MFRIAISFVSMVLAYRTCLSERAEKEQVTLQSEVEDVKSEVQSNCEPVIENCDQIFSISCVNAVCQPVGEPKNCCGTTCEKLDHRMQDGRKVTCCPLTWRNSQVPSNQSKIWTSGSCFSQLAPVHPSQLIKEQVDCEAACEQMCSIYPDERTCDAPGDDQLPQEVEPDPDSWQCPSFMLLPNFVKKADQALVVTACKGSPGCGGSLVTNEGGTSTSYKWTIGTPDYIGSFKNIVRYINAVRTPSKYKQLLMKMEGEQAADLFGQFKFFDAGDTVTIQSPGFLLLIKVFWCILGKRNWQEKELILDDVRGLLHVWWEGRFERNLTEEDKTALENIIAENREKVNQEIAQDMKKQQAAEKKARRIKLLKQIFFGNDKVKSTFYKPKLQADTGVKDAS